MTVAIWKCLRPLFGKCYCIKNNVEGKGKKGGREGGRERQRVGGREEDRVREEQRERDGVCVCRREGAGITKETIQMLLTGNR